ncbi:MAG: hypothetical protein ACYS8W_20625 [Planctomycetota bacterium]
MSAEKRRKSLIGAIGENLFLMLALNIVPLCIAAYLAYGYFTGRLSFTGIPRSFIWLTASFFVAVGVVAAAAWGFLPAAVALRRRARAWLRRAANRFRGIGGGFFGGMWYGAAGSLGYCVGSVVYLVGWLIFAAGCVASVTVIVVMIFSFG